MATETGDSDTESGESISPYMRSITVTTAATLLGVVAAILSTLYATVEGEPDTLLGGLFLVAAIAVQFPLYNLVGIDVEDFGTKDQLYIFFMTFVMWFVVWTITLTTGAFQ